MSVKFISDLHFYDSYSMDWRKKWASLDSYVREVQSKWNSNIDNDDTVIVVGDIGYKCKLCIEAWKSLHGKKVLVKGNHDDEWGRDLYQCGIFQGIYSELLLDNVYIRHIPEENKKYTYLVHGHHHDYTMPGMQRELQSYIHDVYRLNCAADIIGNKPMTLQELVTRKEVYLEKLGGSKQ